MLDDFCRNVDLVNVRVYPPKPYILVCGGLTDVRALRPLSLRDAFLREAASKPQNDFDIITTEEISDFFQKNCPYTDLVEFEMDLASVCELILIFPESPGSFTELGCFYMAESTRRKLFIAIQSSYLQDTGFVNQGPLQNLLNTQPNSVYGIVEDAVNISRDCIKDVDQVRLHKLIIESISIRIDATRGHTKFEAHNFNHWCKLYVGLLRETTCLSDDEIILMFDCFGVNVSYRDIDRISFCCKQLQWSDYTRIGMDRIHYADRDKNEATRFTFKSGVIDKIRRRSEFREFWSETQPERLAAIGMRRI